MGVKVAVGSGVMEGCNVGVGDGVSVLVAVGKGVKVWVGAWVRVGVWVQVEGGGKGVAVWVGGMTAVVWANGLVVGEIAAAAAPLSPIAGLLSFVDRFITMMMKKNSKRTTPPRAIVSKLERGELSFIIER